jgi:hypothetical protein
MNGVKMRESNPKKKLGLAKEGGEATQNEEDALSRHMEGWTVSWLRPEPCAGCSVSGLSLCLWPCLLGEKYL